MKATIIVNPISSRIDYPDSINRIEQALKQKGYQVNISLTSSPLEATDLTRRAEGEGSKLIISVGGDGTLNEVINGISGPETKLGIIPTGLSNVLALELGIPSDPDKAIRIITSGHTRTLDLGVVNDRLFSTMVSIGLDAEAVRVVNPTLKKFLKRYSYHLAGLKALISFQPKPFIIKTEEGVVLSGSSVVISNARFYGGPHQINPEARVDDGYLRCCLFEKGARRDYARYFLGILLKKHLSFPDVHSLKTTGLRIDTPGLPIQADGDYIGQTPARVKILPKRLTVLIG
ncbi:MAG: diacylglycerol kinase family protein [Candidatus Auribacterota bacterium]|nr:diacylglycerol kinase family protein [Candidatus Auribacterota bacterium]